MGDALYSHAVQVRWRDTDALGHVNHAVMLTYLEEGRDAFLTSRLGALPMYVIVRMELEFLGELRLDRRTVMAEVDAIKLGRTSFTLSERLAADGSELARHRWCACAGTRKRDSRLRCRPTSVRRSRVLLRNST